MFRVEHHKLTDKIKAIDNQVIRTDDPIPKGISGLIYLIIGKKGMGKSSLLLNLLNTKVNDGGLKKYYDNIYFVSPTADSPNEKKFKKLVKELKEHNKFYDKCDEENLNTIVDEIKAYNKENEVDNPLNLLILDDCVLDLPKNQSDSILNKVVILARHLRTSVFVLSQKYNAINTVIRRNADIISFFRTDNKKELKSLCDDVNVDEWKLKALYDFATADSPNDFLHINLLSTPVSYYKKFDKIII